MYNTKPKKRGRIILFIILGWILLSLGIRFLPGLIKQLTHNEVVSEGSSSGTPLPPSAKPSATPVPTPKPYDEADLATTIPLPYTGTVPPDTVFEPIAPKNDYILADAIEWAVNEFGYIEEYMSAVGADLDKDMFSGGFYDGNELYKLGAYEEAIVMYEGILSEYPAHLGARNNYVLALVQQERFEESLRNSILLGMVHPSYEGNWVNILIPLYALGYDNPAYADVLANTEFPDAEELETAVAAGEPLSEIQRAYAYNRVYADMEGEIYHYDLSDLNSLGDILQAAVESDTEIRAKYNEFMDTLLMLRSGDREDTDYLELVLYLEGLMKLRLSK